jgi:hypothetical protein
VVFQRDRRGGPDLRTSKSGEACRVAAGGGLGFSVTG